MRVTNKMMSDHMLYNINSNKKALSLLEQQYTTGMKIQRPSEDPIIAVRALKLRSNLAELNQYYEKNIPDAMAWMDVSESALKVVNSILTQIHTYCVNGATDTLTAEDRSDVVKNLAQLKQQIYQEGDTNYAGRYVFTGYKTNTSLIFSEAQSNEQYRITQPMKGTDIDVVKKTINSCPLDQYNPDDPLSADLSQKPNMITAYRMRLAYNGLDGEEDGEGLAVRFPQIDEDGNIITDEDGEIEYDDFSGAVVEMLSTDAGAFEPEEGTIHFLKDTGELILGADIYQDWKQRSNIEITYDKTKFAKNDLRPEHYFNCTVTDLDAAEDGEEVEPKVYTKQNQEISYEINFNQKLVINTQGADAFQHEIGRTIDTILNAVEDVTATENKIAEVEKMLKDDSLTTEQKDTLNEMLEMLKAEMTLKTEVMQSSFERSLTEIEEQQDVVNVALADLGARYVRLQLTENRLSDEQVDFEDLLSTNEDADLVEVIIKYQSMWQIYSASLSAASKSMQTTLLDFL